MLRLSRLSSCLLLSTPLCIRCAKKMRLLDIPDGTALKIHGRPVANAGGLVLAFSVLPAVLVWGAQDPGIWVVTLGALAALALGLVDDLKGAGPLTRLFLQAAIGAGCAWAGLRAGLFRSVFLDGALATCVVIGAINAVNLLDGMDGLASGVAAICCAAFAAFSYAHGDAQVFVLASACLAAFIGFLPYNFNPASIFLGNSGSSLAGFLLAVLVILSLRSAPTPGGFIGSLLIVGLPLADTALCDREEAQVGKGDNGGRSGPFLRQIAAKRLFPEAVGAYRLHRGCVLRRLRSCHPSCWR